MSAFRTVALLSAFLVVAACGGSDDAPPPPAAAVVLDCAYPDAPTVAAPDWVCTEFLPDLALSAVGSAAKSSAGVDFMTSQASLAARVKLAQTMSTEISNLTKQFAQTTGAGDTESVDLFASSTSKSVTAETLRGSRLYKKSTNPETGQIYVLIGLGDEQVNAAIDEALQTSYANDQALWQQFQAERSFDELAEEIKSQRDQ